MTIQACGLAVCCLKHCTTQSALCLIRCKNFEKIPASTFLDEGIEKGKDEAIYLIYNSIYRNSEIKQFFTAGVKPTRNKKKSKQLDTVSKLRHQISNLYRESIHL